MNWIKNYLINRAKKTPYLNLDGYMNRYWLVPYTNPKYEGCGFVKWYKSPLLWLIQKCGIAIRIHEILSSDDTRALHDHPWSFCTILLKGSYLEFMPHKDGSGGLSVFRRKQGSILFRKTTDRHRLELIANQPVTTLFITFKYKQKWGFWVTPTDKVLHGDYQK